MKLVSLEQTKSHLRIRSGNTSRDDYIELLIEGASKAINRRLKEEGTELYLDSSGDPENVDSDDVVQNVDSDIKIATLMLIGWVYKNPDEDPAKAFSNKFLPDFVEAWLVPIKDPTLR